MTNVEFELAEQFALHTRRHCFVTGKAGTGKTTLLRRLADRTQKNVVVVAPTGVAAVNAGGVTIHSMFGLPLTCFVHKITRGWAVVRAVTCASMGSEIHVPAEPGTGAPR
jgi:ATP-dependent DNA helicase PIF1